MPLRRLAQWKNLRLSRRKPATERHSENLLRFNLLQRPEGDGRQVRPSPEQRK